MRNTALRRITESGIVDWPWTAPTGLAIITGASGGGGGGALCLEGLNLFGSAGGGGGGGGGPTTLRVALQDYRAAGGDGGWGGGGGGLQDGLPILGKRGAGCQYGSGGDGGKGAVASPADGRVTSNGGNGGKGYPGETLIISLEGLSKGDRLEVEIGQDGGGGVGGGGYKPGDAGANGADGHVLLVPLHIAGEAK